MNATHLLPKGWKRNWKLERCPMCGAAHRASYVFGLQDATVHKYACGHCVCDDGWNGATFHDDYTSAATTARTIKQRNWMFQTTVKGS